MAEWSVHGGVNVWLGECGWWVKHSGRASVCGVFVCVEERVGVLILLVTRSSSGAATSSRTRHAPPSNSDSDSPTPCRRRRSGTNTAARAASSGPY